MPFRLCLLATLLLAAVLSLCATGGTRASAPGTLAVQRTAAPPEAVLNSGPRRAEHRAAQLEDDDDDLACKPDAMAGHPHAVPPARDATAAARARRACRLSMSRSAAFRARQRLDDSFPTGPPSILR